METIKQEEHETFILLKHPNGETKWLPIECWGERYISVRWPCAGLYDLMLKKNVLMARSATVRIRHPHNFWHAVNLSEARLYVADKLGITKDEMEERFKTHHDTMP